MSCKYYKSTMFNAYCTARRREEKVTDSHAREYCRSCSKYEKCNAYKEASGGRLFGGWW